MIGQLHQISKKHYKTEFVKKSIVVLIANDNSKRLDWPLALVQDLSPGKNGEVRLVRLKTAGGTVLRPIQRLCLIETTPWEARIFLK
ncbi:hypothetical protein NQ314_019028 [Rhamnusium bicolor]|uniref:DUF5641 domain-containing protein n=1 Tax=Rhamnusium bicolor TaxID=1586634 RepID=A0AAV8WPK8_9CUCU|nr:hypothetical protein NQ314_019028 [Rhamnusium bicolor]